MALLLDFQGRAIRLTDERRQHILEHPEMATLEGEIGKTLQEPEIVRRSRSDATVSLYYRFYTNTIVFDEEFDTPSKAFFQQVQNNQFQLVTSPVVQAEIDTAPKFVRDFLIKC